ncbi:hypothetical protein [Spirosoma fluviale]|uniref:Uncharacterized protein n=1 Tax=Spirosoma fluviale TaxID=1597977 RepID=A0A286GWW8_9BACT|nr:hypothetical protein [Spirosoma fluviale]SOD99666.1 hypothetical protein SAMN06269250_0101 [Spirosoma fluviale]
MNLLKCTFRTTVVLLASASLSFAQNANQAAVDTLTKDVAIAVFAKISQPKAQEIYAQLLACDDGCDPQQVIRGVGSWDQVGAKMQELSELKNTARFVSLPPEEANVAIRRQLAIFYEKYKRDKNYGTPLSPDVQARILAKIDAILPPAEPQQATAPAKSPSTAAQTAVEEETSITPATLQLSQLERQAKEAEKKQLWMLLLGAVGGLILGAGAVYLLAYRGAQNEVDRLLRENKKLSKENDGLRNKPVNEPRKPQSDVVQKASAFDAIVTELGTDNPLAAIRQLTRQPNSPGTSPAPKVVPRARQSESVVEPTPPRPTPVQKQAVNEQAPAPTPVPAPIAVPTPVPAPQPARSVVFYFPPPDPNGQFDSQHKADSLSPESAYRFSIDAKNPSLATFRFEAEPGRVARFLTYRNYMIEPACDSENSYMTSHTRISMRRDGEAVLENGSWRVKTKALIRYE